MCDRVEIPTVAYALHPHGTGFDVAWHCYMSFAYNRNLHSFSGETQFDVVAHVVLSAVGHHDVFDPGSTSPVTQETHHPEEGVCGPMEG